MKDKIKRIFHTVYNFIACLTGDNVSIYAAQASFFLVISVIPFLLFIFTIMKMFIEIDQQHILHLINSFAPVQISRFITVIFNELFDKTSSISVISITVISALWLSSRGIMALYMGLNNLYHIPPRNWLYVRLISILYTLALIATLILTIIFFGFGNKIEHFLEMRSYMIAGIMQWLMHGRVLIFVIYLTLIFTLFYKFLPAKNMKFTELIPGAAFAAGGWLVFSYLYSIYIENFSNYTYVYGSVAAVVFLMLWLYFCMNIFLYGAQINKMIKNGFFTK